MALIQAFDLKKPHDGKFLTKDETVASWVAWNCCNRPRWSQYRVYQSKINWTIKIWQSKGRNEAAANIELI